MPRKTKEINEEKVVKKQSKLNEKIDSLIKTILEPNDKTEVTKAKKATPKKTSKAKTSEKNKEEKVAPKKTTKKAVTEKATSEKTSKKATTKKATSEKTTKKTVAEKDSAKKTAKKSTATKDAKTTQKPTTKKTATKKVSTATSTKTTKSKTVSKAKSSSTSKTTVTKTKSAKVVAPTVVEYYDLPYKYNQTVVKVLYQNPTTLFVYWEISDGDIENYKQTYGDNFFETTRPVLVVYNDTMNYRFEVDINDFANSWYFNINDSKCDYRVELIRRPVFYNEKIKTDYVYITSSNKINTPNDRILFSTNEPYTVYFKNTKNNTQRKVNLPKLLKQLNLSSKDFGFPIVRNVYDLYKNIYHIEDVGEFSVSLDNPSSRGGNPSSHSLSSRFTY